MAGRAARTLALSGALLAPGALAAAATTGVMKGISYGPTPVTTPGEAARLPEDDYFCDEAAPMWSAASGRGDLRIMRSLGANLVRLYGNDPRRHHGRFLDEAQAQGLQVAVGMSDWPYYQQVPGSCLKAADAFNCFPQVRPLYLDNLRKGFLRGNEYHPAIRVVNVLNEPDLKMPPTATTGGSEGAVLMARSLISAFDAMLDAERFLEVTGTLVNFTATFSYAVCMACEKFRGSPALGQMAQLDDAMHHPERYGYTPKNDITTAYKKRWMHSFNTQNPATDLQHQFLDFYNQAFPATPVYIGEYHRVAANQTEDLGTIFAAVEANELFVGISFFEYTVSYYKTGSEMAFGMFGYGNDTVVDMDYFGQEHPVKCLVPVASPESGTSMAESVARVFGGRLDASLTCGGNGSLPAEPTAAPDSTAAPAPADATTQAPATPAATTGFLSSTSTTGAAAAPTGGDPGHADIPLDVDESAAAATCPRQVVFQACVAAVVSASAACAL